jgi:hypothetical protein
MNDRASTAEQGLHQMLGRLDEHLAEEGSEAAR